MPWVKRGRKTVYVNPKHAGGRKQAKKQAVAIAKAPVGVIPEVSPPPSSPAPTQPVKSKPKLTRAQRIERIQRQYLRGSKVFQGMNREDSRDIARTIERQERRGKTAEQIIKRVERKIEESGNKSLWSAEKAARKAVRSYQKPGGRKVTVGVPEIVPKRYRRAVAVYGQLLNDALKDAGIKMSGPEYLARLIQFESSWNKRARGPSIPVDPDGAEGFGQFIESTAKDFRERLGVETTDPRKPKQMIKGAAMHASGKYGYRPLYGGYNPGYSKEDPIPSVPAGENVPVKVSRKRLKKAAQGRITKGAVAKKLPGPYEGARRFVRQLVGTKVRGDKEPGHSTGGMHDPANPRAYAQDINLPGGNPSEREPGYNQQTVSRIVRNLRKRGASIPKDFKLGQDWRGVVDGYEVEFLTSPHGTGPHIHIGAEWVGTSGASASPGTGTGGSASGGPSLTASGAGSPPARAGQSPAARRRNRERNRERRRLLKEILSRRVYPVEEPPEPSRTRVRKTTRTRSRKVTLGL